MIKINVFTAKPAIKVHQQVEFYVLIIAFRLLMDYMYREVVGTTYAYMGFEYNPNLSFAVLSWLLLLCGMVLMYRGYANEKKKLSFEVVLLLFIMSFIPFTSMVHFGALSNEFTIGNTVFWFLILLFTIQLKREEIDFGTNISIESNAAGLGEAELRILATVFAAVVLFISARYSHFRFNFDLLSVYEFRAEAASNNLPLWLTYLFSWSRTINSILIAYFIRQKKSGWVAGCCLVQLLSFGYDGSKSTLFLLLLAVGIGLMPQFEMNMLNKWALRGLVVLAALVAVHFHITRNFVPISILFRRVFFLPVRIAKDYFAYFTENEPDFFRQGFLRYFGMESPYQLSIPYLIGSEYFGDASMSANNGLIADAIANLGYAGIVIYPMFYAIVFTILDKASEGLDPRIFLTVGIYLSLVLTNSFIFTILLTHGLIIAMLVLHQMRRGAQNDVAEELSYCVREEKA